MPVERARRTGRRLAALTVLASFWFLASGVGVQPVHAADDLSATAAAAVAAMEAAGMECQVDENGTRCDVGADCGSGPDDICSPETASGPWAVGGITFEEAVDDEPPVVFVNLSYFPGGTSKDPSGARPTFQAVIAAICPEAAAGADAWLSAPEPFAMVPGDGCAIELDSGTDALVPSMHIYSLHLEQEAASAVLPTASATPIAPAPATATPAPGSLAELAANMVTILEQSGMTCITSSERTHCFIGHECSFDALVLNCSGTLFAPVTEGGFSTRPAAGYGFWLEHQNWGDTQDPSGMRAVFDKVVELACPDAAAAAAEWFARPTERSRYPGDGCEVFLQSSSEDYPGSGTEHTYRAGFAVDEADPSPSSVAGAASASPAATAAVAAPVPGGEPSDGGSGAAVVPPGGFVASITTPSRVTLDPTVALQSAVLALLILFLMPFPAQLFNSTVEEHRDEIRGWFAPLARGLRSAGSGIGAFWRSPVGIVSFLLVSALLYALLDPSFSLSVDGLITIIGILAGLVVVTALFSVPAVLSHGRRGDRPVLEAIPFTLVIAVVCVGISRLADFQPGYLYGLIIGIGFARTLDPTGEGRTGAAAAALMLVSALLAWIGLGLMVDAGIEGFVGVVLATILAAVMVAGLEGVAFGLLPIRSLPGEPIYAWNRLVWGVLIFLGLFAFMHVLINPQSGYLGDTSRTPLLTMVALLVGFGALSVAFWGYFRFRPERVEA